MNTLKLRSKKLIYEYIAVAIVSLICAGAAAYIDLFEILFNFTRKYEDMNLDELFSVMIIFFIIALIFSIRRIFDLRREMLERIKTENLIKETNAELSARLEEIKILQGIIPICVNCKKIRDGEGFWHQVENYISSHSDAVFSHSLCSECVDKLYPDLKRNK